MYWDKKEHDKFEVSIKALIYAPDGKLLFARDTKGKWDLPGGRISQQENIEECLRREVFEELGVEINSIAKTPKYADLIQFDDHKKRFSIGYVVDLRDFHFKQSEENIETKFISLQEFDGLNQAYAGLKRIKNLLYS